jgi:ferric-dicitrate binding protein FerR (iron transport regulator)
MRTRAVLLAGVFTALSASSVALATWRMRPLRAESEALLASSRIHADAFASSLDGQFADRQLDTFQARREVVARLQRWQRLQLLGILGVAAGLFGGWLLWLLGRVHTEFSAEPDRPR